MVRSDLRARKVGRKMQSGNPLSGYSTLSLRCSKIPNASAHTMESNHDITEPRITYGLNAPAAALMEVASSFGPHYAGQKRRIERITYLSVLYSITGGNRKLTPTRTLFSKGLYITPPKYIKDKLSLRSSCLH